MFRSNIIFCITFVTHVLKPQPCSLDQSDGGNICPHSPTTIMLLVVDFTCRTQHMYQKLLCSPVLLSDTSTKSSAHNKCEIQRPHFFWRKPRRSDRYCRKSVGLVFPPWFISCESRVGGLKDRDSDDCRGIWSCPKSYIFQQIPII